MRFSKFLLLAVVLAGMFPVAAHSEDEATGSSRFGQGGRPSEAQIAEWRAKRAAREAQAAASATSTTNAPVAAASEHRHGPPSVGANPGTPTSAGAEHRHGPGAGKPVGMGKPDEAARTSGRPGGMPMGARSGALWLSDTPPMRGDGQRPGGMRGGMGGMGGMEMGGAPGAVPSKKLWLRSGNDPQRSGFAHEDGEAQIDAIILKPFGTAEGESLTQPEDAHGAYVFEMPSQGFYRAYVTSRKLQGDTLMVNVAKAEISNFGHGGDEEEAAKALTGARVLDSAPIEVVRERKPDEKKFFQLKSGDEQSFVVLQKGLPLQGARVRFVSHMGWIKEAVSDEQGRVSFQVVRDYFPPWDDFQKRFKATYLVIAEASTTESGKFKDQPYTAVRYQTSLAGNYYPSPNDYQSYAWGLGIGLLITLFCGVAVYLYRRRRVKPYREERLEDGK